jgi:hypothetical protein
MKKVLFLLVIALFATGMALAQGSSIGGNGDILGPHNVNGHGCASCHAPHNGAAQNTSGGNSATGETYLWGRGLIATTYNTFGGKTMTTLATYSETDVQFHTAACLSCHDGSVQPAGMNGTAFEATQDGLHPNTYINSDSLKNDHPVDVAYDTTKTSNWPGTVDVNGTITWTATTPAMDYGHPVRFYGDKTTGKAMVECSTCHNPHAMNIARVKLANGTSVNKPTAFFIRGWYDDGNAASNSTTQFCRSCHYSKSNEYVGNTVPTV